MNAPLFTSTGEKRGTIALPTSLFEAKVLPSLMHQAVVVQLSSQRHPIAHTKTRGEVRGSNRKLYMQKHTGRARRGGVRSPILKGGGVVFGPRRERNFRRQMPAEQRRRALLSSLTYQAKQEHILALTDYPDTVKTKTLITLLRKLPVPLGRHLLVVLPGHHRGLELSSRNVPKVKMLLAPYLNPYDVLRSHAIIFLEAALKIAEETFGERRQRKQKADENDAPAPAPSKTARAKRTKAARAPRKAPSPSVSPS